MILAFLRRLLGASGGGPMTARADMDGKLNIVIRRGRRPGRRQQIGDWLSTFRSK